MECQSSVPICEPGGKGLILPVTESEADLPTGVRAAIYGIMMLYFFVGVAIIADTFVASIDTITMTWKRVKNSEGQLRTTKVWNETVATLTLMALGSSAPEIALAILDVFKKNFHAAELGPSTIVGSASFNLLVIIAVCIMAIPSDEVRIIKELPAFYITAFFSLAAYMWLCFILVFSSKDQIDVWEAVLTFLFLPLLVYVSYKTDVGAFDCMLAKVGIIDDTASRTSETLHGRRQSEFVREARSSGNGCNGSAVDMAKAKYCFVSFKDEEETMEITLSNEEQEVQIPIATIGARNGSVLVSYRSSGFSAIADIEYEHCEDVIEFEEDQSEAFITLKVNPWTGVKAQTQLLIILEDAIGADFNPDTDGDEQCSILTVTLKAPEEPTSFSKCLYLFLDCDGVKRGFNDWKEQFMNCIYVNGSKEAQAEAEAQDWAMHIMAAPWKLMFAFVPPPSFFGGWLCFFSSLGGIGLLTSFVSDFAELFGCVLELGDIVTAITFVALGTSMPDLFASLTAAKEDETADASVVNVTGSNSVNVFLGLGLPWTICAIYWSVRERTPEWTACYPEAAARLPAGSMAFVVESGYIGFSVGAFSCVCLAALLLITLRRRWIGAELGGPFVPKLASALQLLLLWAGWVAIVVWRVLRYDESPGQIEEGIASFGFMSVLAGGMVVTICILYVYRVPPGSRDNRRLSNLSKMGSGELGNSEHSDGSRRNSKASDTDQKDGSKEKRDPGSCGQSKDQKDIVKEPVVDGSSSALERV